MTQKIYSRDEFFRDQYRCVVDGGALPSSEKKCGLYGLSHHTVDISGDATNAGQQQGVVLLCSTHPAGCARLSFTQIHAVPLSFVFVFAFVFA